MGQTKENTMAAIKSIEKAHPEVFNVLLQALDDGRLTDNKGRTVNFKNTIIIMTSNLGAQYIMERVGQMNDFNRDTVYEDMKSEVLKMLRQRMRPEFLNRIDEIIMFRPLNRDHIRAIVNIQFRRVQELLKRQGIGIELSNDARNFLAEAGFDQVFGARPLKRLIQNEIINALSEELLKGHFMKGDGIVVGFENGQLSFTKQMTTHHPVA